MAPPFPQTYKMAFWHAARATKGSYGAVEGPPVGSAYTPHTKTWYDAAGLSRNLTIPASVGANAESGWKGFGGAATDMGLVIPGSGKRVDVADMSVGEDKTFTYEGWARVTGTGTLYLFNEGNSANVNQYAALYLYQSGATFHARAGAKDGTTAVITDAYTPTGSVRDWRHLCMTADGTNLYLYDNGVLVGTKALPAGALDFNIACIGALRRTTSTYSTASEIGPVRVYNRCLSAEEVMHNACVGRALDGYIISGLVADWHPGAARSVSGGWQPGSNPAATTTWEDRAGSNDGTLVGWYFDGDQFGGWMPRGRREEPYRLAFRDPSTTGATFASMASNRYMTFAARVYPRRASSWRDCFVLHENYLNRGWRFGYDSNGALRWWNTQSGGNIDCGSSAGLITPGRWYTVGYSVDQTAGTVYIFCDGVIVGTATGTHVALDGTETFTLGTYFDGEVAWAGLWGDAADAGALVNSDGRAALYCATPTDWPMDGANPLFDGSLYIDADGTAITAHVLPGLSFSTTSPGGFAEAQLALRTDGSTRGHPIGRGSAVSIQHGAGVVLFEGEATDDSTLATLENGRAIVHAPCAGKLYTAARRDDFGNVWVDTDLDQWEMGPFSWSPFSADTDGRLCVYGAKGQNYTAYRGITLDYALLENFLTGATIGNPADIVSMELTTADFDGSGNGIDVGATNWYFKVQTAPGPWGPWTDSRVWNNTTSAAGTVWRVPASGSFPVGTKAVRGRLYSDSSLSPSSNDRFACFKAVRVRVGSPKTVTGLSVTAGNPATIVNAFSHGLVTGDQVYLQGFSGESPNIQGYYTVTVTSADNFTIPVNCTVGGTGGTMTASPRVDEAMTDVAMSSGLAATSDTQPVGNTILGTVAARPFITRADALDELAALHSEPFEWGFWDSATWVCKPRPTAPSYSGQANFYRIDPRHAGVDVDLHTMGEGVPDYVRVLYSFVDVDGGTSAMPDGTITDLVVRATGLASWPAFGNADQRVAILDLSDQSLTTAQAQSAGEQFLAWVGRGVWDGTITYRLPYIDLWDGGRKIAAYVRAGDWLWVEGVTYDAAIYITATEFDVDSCTLTMYVGDDYWQWKRRDDIDPPVRRPESVPRSGVRSKRKHKMKKRPR